MPDEPLDLPVNERLTIDVEVAKVPLRGSAEAITAAFERARLVFTEEDLDAME